MKPQFRKSVRLICEWPACSWGYYEDKTEWEALEHWKAHEQAFNKAAIRISLEDKIVYRRSLGDPDGCGPYTREEEAVVVQMRGVDMELEILAEREGGAREWVRVYSPSDGNVRCHIWRTA